MNESDKINFMDIKNIVDYTIRRISVHISKRYSESVLTEYLEKYECENIKQLLYVLLCELKPSDLNISLNMRQTIKNISLEVAQDESDNQQYSTDVLNLIKDNDALSKKVEELEELFVVHNSKLQELFKINQALTQKLKSQQNKNNLGL